MKCVTFGHKWALFIQNGQIDMIVSNCIIYIVRGNNKIKLLRKCFDLIRQNKNKNLTCITEIVNLK